MGRSSGLAVVQLLCGKYGARCACLSYCVPTAWLGEGADACLAGSSTGWADHSTGAGGPEEGHQKWHIPASSLAS